MSARTYYPARWRTYRVIYYLGICATFSAAAFYFGPNYLLFGKLTWRNPSDFTSRVMSDGLLVLSEIRKYQADHGQLPTDLRQIGSDDGFLFHGAFYSDHILKIQDQYHDVVTYDLSAPNPSWVVRGPFTSGPVPGIPPERPARIKSTR